MISKIKTDETEEVTTPGISYYVIEYETPPEPDISDLTIEDDTPVDNFQSEKQQRLLTNCLYDSWSGVDGNSQFLAGANVGVFYSTEKPALVPDVFLSLDVTIPDDWEHKKDRSYYTWKFGKAPDVVVEIVSNKVGNELGSKLKNYARMGAWYYVVFDPLKMLGDSLLEVYELRASGYQKMTETWLEKVQLGLTLWSGKFEGKEDVWLRWCDAEGNVIPTGAERAEQEKQEKESALQRAEQEKQEKESALQRAEQEKQEKESALQKLAELEAKLRDLGIEPD
ncbi:Uma2 family endonuclease [Okeania sp.]|uniref:Uma2 family endonuclease n=1 Tax=Okeania sp. TaxID=3100323 RepID=UPI002B4B4C24|nr:Uma2 family endonuclease [Okeania sp.]MEB3339949.1 Uma2 family endonuclease [Okeania sp.]